MDIRFIGTGGAFQVDQVNSSALVSLQQGTVLIDCGHSVFQALVQKGVIDEIDAVLVTHFHDDHVGSLSSLILYYNLILQKGKMVLLTPNEEFEDALKLFLSHSLGDPTERVDFRRVGDWPAIQSIDTFGMHVAGMQTWAFTFSEAGSSIAYSGDLGEPTSFFQALRGADLPNLRVFHETSYYEQVNAHTYYKVLEGYMDEFEVYAYHCDPHTKPADLKLNLVAESTFLIESVQ